MPFTPYHLGPGLLFGLIGFRWLDLPTFVVASVIVDVRAVLVLLGLVGGPIHGPLHTFAGGGALALVVAGVMYPIRPRFDQLLKRLRLPQDRSTAGIAIAAFGGIWLHVVLDAFLYADLRPFAPVNEANPFLGEVSTAAIYGGCVVAAVLGIGVYAAVLLGYVSLPADRVDRS